MLSSPVYGASTHVIKVDLNTNLAVQRQVAEAGLPAASVHRPPQGSWGRVMQGQRAPASFSTVSGYLPESAFNFFIKK